MNRRRLIMIHLLEEKGANVSYHDPHVPAFQHEGMEMVGVTDLDLALRLADCVVIVTDHTAYDWTSIQAGRGVFVDTRHVADGVHGDTTSFTGNSAANAPQHRRQAAATVAGQRESVTA